MDKKPAMEQIAAFYLVVDRQQKAQQLGLLNVWTVYDHPRDFPDNFVARRFETGGGEPEPVVTSDVLVGDLKTMRETFEQAGLVCLMRSEGDDAKIVETWM
jgi:hypothetical protein